MPEAESPQLRRERTATLVVFSLLCFAVPCVVVLVCSEFGPVANRRIPLTWFAGTAAVGAVLPFLYWAPYRALGLVPYAATAWLAAVAHGTYWNEWPGWANGLPLGVMLGALARGRRGKEPLADTIWPLAAGLLGIGVAWVALSEQLADWLRYAMLPLAVLLVAWSWWRLFRPVFELSLEPPVWFVYHIRGRGPGLTKFPRTGPCLILANHACWFDPLFLAKVIPRPITPMMTARFYDLPYIRRLMVAFGVIRVPEKALKKEAPEIKDAIAALDRGECVVVFPEGYLRRNEDRPLRRFGQGVWQVLQARPDTPVFACWIEGGWGSYTSYQNGPPTKNKKKDFRRRIGVGVSAAATVPAEELTEHMRTRLYLMNLVSAARLHLGLPALPPFEWPPKEDSKSEDGENG